jgi:hypothetical protein
MRRLRLLVWLAGIGLWIWGLQEARVLATCGLHSSLTAGTLIQVVPAGVLQERRPDAPNEIEYHVANRPIVRFRSRDGRTWTVSGGPERAPSSRRVGDKVPVCYDERDPTRARVR